MPPVDGVCEDPSDPPSADHLPTGRGEGQEAPSASRCSAPPPPGAGEAQEDLRRVVAALRTVSAWAGVSGRSRRRSVRRAVARVWASSSRSARRVALARVKRARALSNWGEVRRSSSWSRVSWWSWQSSAVVMEGLRRSSMREGREGLGIRDWGLGEEREDPSDPPSADHLPTGRGEGQEAPSASLCSALPPLVRGRPRVAAEFGKRGWGRKVGVGLVGACMNGSLCGCRVWGRGHGRMDWSRGGVLGNCTWAARGVKVGLG